MTTSVANSALTETMILYSCPGQVRKAGRPLTSCRCAVRAAAYAGSLTSSFSQGARSQISGGSSSKPTSRSPYKIGNAKCPPVLGNRLVHLQLMIEVEDQPPNAHRSCPSGGACGAASECPAGLCLGGPPGASAIALNGTARAPSRLTQARRAGHSRPPAPSVSP